MLAHVKYVAPQNRGGLKWQLSSPGCSSASVLSVMPTCRSWLSTWWLLLTKSRRKQNRQESKRRVQHWERSACASVKNEDYGILWEERKADWAAEENVSFENHWAERVQQVHWGQQIRVLVLSGPLTAYLTLVTLLNFPFLTWEHGSLTGLLKYTVEITDKVLPLGKHSINIS